MQTVTKIVEHLSEYPTKLGKSATGFQRVIGDTYSRRSLLEIIGAISDLIISDPSTLMSLVINGVRRRGKNGNRQNKISELS